MPSLKRFKTISRQAKWQNTRRKARLCVICGNEPLLTKNHGRKCSKKIRETARLRNGAKTRYKNARSYQRPTAEAR